ncbi:MAG: Alpha amylase, catalytic domain protein [Edaphobacter sp.]|nr:Alpha amylase, catalytic domain protein [Edaphobacter sp.]
MSIRHASVYAGATNGIAGRTKEFVSIFARHGGTDVLLYPPCQQPQQGGGSSSLGYDPNRDLDTGQFANFPLRWGTAEKIQSANIVAHEHGVSVEVDWPIRQYGGDAPLVEKGASGRIDQTILHKPASCFLPIVVRDAAFDSQADVPDGTEVSYQGSLPRGYMLQGEMQSGCWTRRRLGWNTFRGVEFKAESGETAEALVSTPVGQNFAEVFTGDPSELNRYVRQTRIPVLDFTEHFAYRDVSTAATLAWLVNSGYWSLNSAKLCFTSGATIPTGPPELLTTNSGSMSTRSRCLHGRYRYRQATSSFPSLATGSSNMMWFAATSAFGKLACEFVSDSLFVWSRDGHGGEVGWSDGIFRVINSDPINKMGVWSHTLFTPGTRIHHYANTYGNDSAVNQDGWGSITVNSNVTESGQSYALHAAVSVDRIITPQSITKTISGDLTDFSEFTLKFQSEAK